MSIPRFCPECGDVIGVKTGLSGLFGTSDRGTPDRNAPCKGTHGTPVRKTVGKEIGGLIEITRTDYPDGSSSPLVKQYVGPASGWKFWVLCIYINVFRQTVYGKGEEEGWIWPGSKPSQIRKRVGMLKESEDEQPKLAEH